MKKIKALFTDIGGVILTNGWDHICREKAIVKFKLEPDKEEINERHHLTYDTFELGKIDLTTYLKRTVFYQKRNFTQKEFKDFMFLLSTPFPDMINLIREVKSKNNLRTLVISNESKELNNYRIKKFRLKEIIDGFISSSYVNMRKPDEGIFRMALDISQYEPDEVVYMDDRMMFVEIANSLGINGIQHTDIESTKQKLQSFGLKI
ncbi:MAG: HAD hydrolase-like protein [Bacteroidetes bacterium]|nr:HAD hydrolase-like protein [Bacteroidota bacterium]